MLGESVWALQSTGSVGLVVHRRKDQQAVVRIIFLVVLATAGVLRGFDALPQVAAIMFFGGLIGITIYEIRAERSPRQDPRRHDE